MRAHAARPTVGEGLCAALLVSAFGFGGQPGTSHVLVQALGGAALAWALLRGAHAARGLRLILLAAATLAVLQLVPLPPGLWRMLPQRAGIETDLAVAGLGARWRPLTLDALGTIRALLALQVYAGMWLLASRLDAEARVRLLKLALAVGVLLALAGFVQVRGKVDTTGATATFANRNHFASLMAMLVPLACAFACTARDRARMLGGYAIAAVLVLAAALSFSRAGSVLALVAGVASAALLPRPPLPRRYGLAGLAFAAFAAAGIGYLAWSRLGERFGSDVLADARWLFAANGWRAFVAYLPWGSGLGSFRWVYQGFEPAAGLAQYTFATHAHNELLEIGIEAGIPGLLIAAAFVAWVVVVICADAGSARRGRDPVALAWTRACAIACAVVLLHSLVDFPLRTDACSVLLALALAMLASPRRAKPAH